MIGTDSGRAVTRIDQVRTLRQAQFPEDAGPMSHPVRPDSFVEINNFYTVTVYEKGAEVVRMYQTLVGRDGFRKGMDLYFKRHDGQAVECDDFRAAMADANGRDLRQFERWYSQAGTPIVTARTRYDAVKRHFDIILSQRCPASAGQADKLPFHIPVAVGLLSASGKDLPLGAGRRQARQGRHHGGAGVDRAGADLPLPPGRRTADAIHPARLLGAGDTRIRLHRRRTAAPFQP